MQTGAMKELEISKVAKLILIFIEDKNVLCKLGINVTFDPYQITI